MIIKVRRGLEANRTSYTPQVGEPTFTTDTKKLYIGDGVTPGGIQVDLSGGGIVETIVAGTGITIDATDPANPIISATGGGGGAVDSVNGQTGVVELDADDIDDTSTTHKFATAGEKTKLGYIAVTQAVDLDSIESTLASHVANTSNPHSVTKSQVGLSNVPNTDFTAAVAANTAKVSYTDAAKVAGIENGADVTDTANVTAAGALMDSEVANLAAVKAFDPSDYATDTQGGKADTAIQPGDSIDDLSPSQTGHSGKFLKTDGTNASWEAIPGGGDMLAATYDPTGKSADAFSMGNMVETSTKKILSDTERTKLSGIEADADVTDATNVDAAGATMNSDTSLAGNSYFLDEDNMASDSATKVPSQQSVKAYIDAAISTAKQALLPVGSIVVLGVSTNPNTLYGFGTWTAITGRVLVGKAASGTFGTLDATGGAETHTLSVTEMPSHTHVQNQHRHGRGATNGAVGFVENLSLGNSSTRGYTVQGDYTTATNQNTGGDGAHNNLQPYIVKYMWQRTA